MLTTGRRHHTRNSKNKRLYNQNYATSHLR